MGLCVDLAYPGFGLHGNNDPSSRSNSPARQCELRHWPSWCCNLCWRGIWARFRTGLCKVHDGFPPRAYTMVQISYNGHQHLRQRLVLSILSGKPVRVEKIRSEDQNPGLRGELRIDFRLAPSRVSAYRL